MQGNAAGVGVGAFFLLWNGEVRAEYMHRRLHEVPHTGGVSSLRSSWWHDRIRDDAERRLRLMDWQGVAMVEYRWNPDDDGFCLMEMNTRFWGSLHLALYAGVDLPKLLLEARAGRPAARRIVGKRGVRCRLTFPQEVQHVWSLLKDPAVPVTRKLARVLSVIGFTFDPTMRSDLNFPGDRAIYLRALWRFVKSQIRDRGHA